MTPIEKWTAVRAASLITAMLMWWLPLARSQRAVLLSLGSFSRSRARNSGLVAHPASWLDCTRAVIGAQLFGDNS